MQAIAEGTKFEIKYQFYAEKPFSGLDKEGKPTECREAAETQAREFAATHPDWYVNVKELRCIGGMVLDIIDLPAIQVPAAMNDADPWGNDFNNDDLLNSCPDY